jgi:hypothetical protein
VIVDRIFEPVAEGIQHDENVLLLERRDFAVYIHRAGCQAIENDG